MIDIANLVNQYPNDMELGSKVRELYYEGRESIDALTEKMKDAKIFESPDGGSTVYAREFGKPSAERVLIKGEEQ